MIFLFTEDLYFLFFFLHSHQRFYLFFSFNFFPFIFISWRIITSQYCSGFCHTLTWISHGFTCISHPNLLTLLISHSCVNMTYYNCLLLKSHWRARLLEMKVCFIFDAGTWCRGREGCVPAQRLTLPHYPTHPTPPHPTDNQGGRVFMDRGRGLRAERAVSSGSHLEIGHQWSDQCHLDCFRYSQCSVSRPTCSHFLEASSQSCGHSYLGYGLVIVQLTSSTRWGFRVCKRAHKIQIRIVSIDPEKELNVLDSSWWLDYYYLVSFGCFPLLLHFLTSRVKLILWLSFFTNKRQAEGMGEKDHKVLFCFNTISIFIHILIFLCYMHSQSACMLFLVL